MRFLKERKETAMKNAEIIESHAIALMEGGIIKSAGKVETMDGTTVDVPEEIATFPEWRRRGYMVMKGQHAVAKFQIWKPCKRKAKKEGEEDEEGMYLVWANFFAASQVKRMA